MEGLIRECQNQGPIGHNGKYPDLIEIGASCKEVREGGGTSREGYKGRARKESLSYAKLIYNKKKSAREGCCLNTLPEVFYLKNNLMAGRAS